MALAQQSLCGFNMLHLMDYSLNVLSIHLQWGKSDWTLQEADRTDQRASHCSVSHENNFVCACVYVCVTKNDLQLNFSSAVQQLLRQVLLFNLTCLLCGGCCFKRWLSPCQNVSLIRGGALRVGSLPASLGRVSALHYFSQDCNSVQPWVIYTPMISALELINGLCHSPEANRSACHCKWLWLLNGCSLNPTQSVVLQQPDDSDEV